MKLCVFQTVSLSIIQVMLTACEQAVSITCMTYTIAVCTVKSPDDRQRNCLKHVEFHFKNKFEKLVHLVGFIVRNTVHGV